MEGNVFELRKQKQFMLRFHFLGLAPNSSGSKTIRAIDLETNQYVHLRFFRSKNTEFATCGNDPVMSRIATCICKENYEDYLNQLPWECNDVSIPVENDPVMLLVNHDLFPRLMGHITLGNLSVYIFEDVFLPTLLEISRTQIIREEDALNILNSLIDAITYLHSNNIVHGAIRTENIYVDQNCRVRLKTLSSSFFYNSDARKYMLKSDLECAGNAILISLNASDRLRSIENSNRKGKCGSIEFYKNEITHAKGLYCMQKIECLENNELKEKLKGILWSSVVLEQIMERISAINQNNHPILALDPLVLNKLQRFDMHPYEFEKSVNDNRLREFYVYRMYLRAVESSSEFLIENIELDEFTAIPYEKLERLFMSRQVIKNNRKKAIASQLKTFKKYILFGEEKEYCRFIALHIAWFRNIPKILQKLFVSYEVHDECIWIADPTLGLKMKIEKFYSSGNWEIVMTREEGLMADFINVIENVFSESVLQHQDYLQN
ncbi:hypothetical protein ENBRE01_2490 [Enteropsectra breve]|nr:hypothetical protein ENBRE01_2490 [Enteropsectra breve]